MKPRVRPSVALTPAQSLVRFIERARVRGEAPTVFTARNRDGSLVAWSVARTGATLAQRWPGKKVRQERMPEDDRALTADLPPIKELAQC